MKKLLPQIQPPADSLPLFIFELESTPLLALRVVHSQLPNVKCLKLRVQVAARFQRLQSSTSTLQNCRTSQSEARSLRLILFDPLQTRIRSRRSNEF